MLKIKGLEVYEKYEKNFFGNSTCNLLDPIRVFNLRLKNGPIEICKGENTNHICYINNNSHYNNMLLSKNGVLCTMKNIILDPSKYNKTNLIFKGYIDKKRKGFPIISKGFFKTKCNYKEITFKYNKIYNDYFNSWDYDYNIENEIDDLEELAPGKIVFLISRYEDSANLYHGNCEIINSLSMLYLFNLSPEDVQVVIYDGMDIPIDPFYDIYKNIISRGGQPIFVKNLKKKYKISNAINIPINLDSPPLTFMYFPKCNSIMRTFKLYNDFVDKYMNLTPFKDTYMSDNVTFYYPDITVKNHKNNIKFKKRLTIQWRKIWPKERKGQTRLLGNAIILANTLAQNLPNDFLVRLIDTAPLPYKEQISIIRSTDYLIGVHGAGLSLSIFLPKNGIMQEIGKYKKNNLLCLLSALSGHPTYSDLLNSVAYYDKEKNEYLFFNETEFVKSVLVHMKENNYDV